jgi:ATP-dependent RNA helicase DHX36
MVNNGRLVDKLQGETSSSAYLDGSPNEQLDSHMPIPFAAAVVAHLAKTTREGANLIFLPGLEEILRLELFLKVDTPLVVDFQNPSKFKDHSAVCNSVPEGCRKIILATDIAETSMTIPDIKYVVDTGKLQEKHYDQERRITELQCTWISQSNSKQRAGRAGRVQDNYYYTLFSKTRIN